MLLALIHSWTSGLRGFFRRLTALMVLVSSFSGCAFACSCLRIGPPCEAAWLQADAVFVGRVYWTVLRPTKDHGTSRIHRIATVKTLEPFRLRI
jgi:hypothetical protein